MLQDHDATIVWVLGKRVEGAEYVRVSADSVLYRRHTDPGGASRWKTARLPDSEKTGSRPIQDVQRIEALVGGGGGQAGLAVGTAPGILSMGIAGVAGLRQDCDDEGTSYCGLGSVLGPAYGVIGALVGGIGGSIIGELADKDRWVVYHRPVEQYLEL